METVLVCLIFAAAACSAVYGVVLVARYVHKKMAVNQMEVIIPVKAAFEAKFYNSGLKAWCGNFFDEVHKSGYVTNLAENDIAAGDRIWVTVGDYDREVGYWRVEADRLALRDTLYAVIVQQDKYGWHCIYPNAKGVAILTHLNSRTDDELKIGGRYPIRITDNGYAELM